MTGSAGAVFANMLPHPNPLPEGIVSFMLFLIICDKKINPK
jgi:hypothetical protein